MRIWPAGALGLVLAVTAYAQVPAPDAAVPAAMAPRGDAVPPRGAGAAASDPMAGSSAPARVAREENARLAALTPAGMSPQEACTGFQSVKECAVALHLAQNLNIPFTDLKAKLTGGETLDAAVRALKPDADAKREVHKAEKEAHADGQARRG